MPQDTKKNLNLVLMSILVTLNFIDLLITTAFWQLGEGNALAVMAHAHFGFAGLFIFKISILVLAIWILEKFCNVNWMRTGTYAVCDLYYVYIILSWIGWIKFNMMHNAKIY